MEGWLAKVLMLRGIFPSLPRLVYHPCVSGKRLAIEFGSQTRTLSGEFGQPSTAALADLTRDNYRERRKNAIRSATNLPRWTCPFERFTPMSDAPIYIFLRMHASVKSSLDDLAELQARLMDVELGMEISVLSFGPPRFCWRDGIVLGLITRQSFRHIADELRPALDRFRSWTLYRSASQFLKSSGSGPLADCKWAIEANPISFCCLLARQSNFAFSTAVSEVEGAMRNSVPYCVFEFNDGAIVAVSSDDPPSIVYRRSERRLSTLFDGWGFVYPDGQLPSVGVTRWAAFDVEGLTEDDLAALD